MITSIIRCLVLILLLSNLGCKEDKSSVQQLSNKQIQELLIEKNKKAVKYESLQIDSYLEKRDLNLISTGTGLRYKVYQKGTGDTIRNGQSAVISYEVSLLDGTICYSTKEKGPEQFMLGNEHAESGLHEAISYLRKGDKALAVIPSHLAHGLAGDFDKIPARSTIIYDIELIDVQ